MTNRKYFKLLFYYHCWTLTTKKTASRDNLHFIKFNQYKFTIHWFLVIIQLCNYYHNPLLHFYSPRKSLPHGCLGLPWWLSGKEFACQYRRYGFDRWIGKIPWRRKRQPTPAFLPGISHGQRSMVGPQFMGSQKSQTWLSE